MATRRDGVLLARRWPLVAKRVTMLEEVARLITTLCYEGRVNTCAGNPDRLIVAGDTVLRAPVQGDVQVQAGASLLALSLITGDLHIEVGAAVEIQGCVDGIVINNGGNLKLQASASCLAIINSGSATCIVDDAASVFLGCVAADEDQTNPLRTWIKQRKVGTLDAD